MKKLEQNTTSYFSFARLSFLTLLLFMFLGTTVLKADAPCLASNGSSTNNSDDIFVDYNPVTHELILQINWSWNSPDKYMAVAVFADFDAGGNSCPGQSSNASTWEGQQQEDFDEFLGQLWTVGSTIIGYASNTLNFLPAATDRTDASIAYLANTNNGANPEDYPGDTPRVLFPYGLTLVSSIGASGTFFVKYTGVVNEPTKIKVLLYDVHDGSETGNGGHSTVAANGSSSSSFDEYNNDNSEQNSYCSNTDDPICFTTFTGGGALPVELGYFRAQENNGSVDLSWNTYSELNNQGFQIQRSKNGVDWNVLDFIVGRGTTDDEQRYHYRDPVPFWGDNYYRLKQIDYDGKYEVSDVLHIRIESDKVGNVEIYPNPTTNNFNVRIHNPLQERVRIKLFDSTGSVLSEQYWQRGEMTETWESSFNLQQKEFYYLMTQIGDEVETEKISVISDQ